MKKVGIVSCYFKNNYGSALQAYATQKILDINNIPNETINITSNIDFKNGKKKYYVKQLLNFGFIKSKMGMIKLKLDKKIVPGLSKNINTRDKKFASFRENFKLSKSFMRYEDIASYALQNYSDIIAGSDQLWLPVNVVADYYTLNWVPEEINTISYATSLGISTIPSKYAQTYVSFLKKINHLSVRESSAVEAIKDISDLDPKLVCDPTILLTSEQWSEIIPENRIIKEKYILCYFLGNNIAHRKFAEKLREETGYIIVSLNHADEYVKYSDKFCDRSPYDIGPSEWMNLIKNAEYVCTDSFHGTVFSILFNKQFFDFRRHNSKSKNSTNSRIDSLLKIAGIDNSRILRGDEDVKTSMSKKINYNTVNENISNIRRDGRSWLLDKISIL